MSVMKCPICLREGDIQVLRREDTQKIKRDLVAATVETSVCPSCHEEFWTSDQTRGNIEAFRSVYRTNHGLLSPTDIVELRRKYDVSQKTLCKLLDIGELTVNSYEQGALLSGAHNNLFRFIETTSNFEELYERNKKKLSELQVRKIAGQLEKLRLAEGYYTYPSGYGELAVAEPTTEYNGHAQRDMERILSLMQLLVHLAKKPLYKMALLKLLFYCDFSYYRLQGLSMTGWRYARLPYGPVPDDYKGLMLVGEKMGRFVVEPDSDERGELLVLPDAFDASVPRASFSPSELSMIEAVVHLHGRRAASELSRMTHEEDGWLNTANAQPISYEWAKSLRHGVTA